MKNMIKRLRNERGLTLVELLAVIVILAIVAVIAFVMIGKVIENSKQDAHIANAQQLISSAKLYEAQGESIDGTVEYEKLKKAGMIDTLTDPWTKEEYQDKNAIVKVTDSGDERIYTVNLKDDGGKYEITDTNGSESKLNQGREAVFGNDEG